MSDPKLTLKLRQMGCTSHSHMNRKCIIETKFPSLFLSEGGSSDGDPVCMRGTGCTDCRTDLHRRPSRRRVRKSSSECASAFKLRLKILPVEAGK